MQYVQPFDQPSNPNASYVNGDPSTGTPGSILPAGAAEYPQREIVNLITAALLTPSNGDLYQLIEALRSNIMSFYTDTGTADALAIAHWTNTPAFGTITEGMEFCVLKTNAANATTTPTLTVDSITQTIVRQDGTSLAIGDLPANAIIPVRCDGSAKFRVTKLVASDILTIAKTATRTRLAANTSFYVNASTGSDTNNGSSGSPWLTMTHAYQYLQSNFDLGGFTITINCAGTTLAPLVAQGPVPGSLGPASIVFVGNTTTPTDVQFSATNASAVNATNGAAFTIKGFEVAATGYGIGQGYGIQALTGGYVLFDQLTFGLCSEAHLGTFSAAQIQSGPVGYTIAGNAAYHASASNAGSSVNLSGAAVTLSGTPAFVDAFVVASEGSEVYAVGATFSGSATGARYLAVLNGIVNTGGGGANFFPGDSAGSTSTGGQYN